MIALVGLGVKVVTDVIIKTQTRVKPNSVLDEVDEGSFVPKDCSHM